jgi:single-stranded DNA-binding protein
MVAPPSSDTAASGTEVEKQERVTIRGRVGKAPRFRTTQKGRLVAQFQLAERDENDQTTWHNIVASDQRAEKVQTDVKSGMPLEVIGYVHEEERQKQDGSQRMDRKVYAVVVKTKL